MGTYRANRNDSEKDVEEKSEEEKKKESTAKALDVGVETGLDVYTAGTFSKAKKVVTSVPIAGKLAQNAWDKTMKTAGGVLAKTPVGDLAKKADDAGITDAARDVKDTLNMTKGKGNKNSSKPNSSSKSNSSSKANSTSKANSSSNKFNSLSKLKSKGSSKGSLLGKGFLKAGNLMSFKTKLIVIGCFVGFFFFICIFMTVFAEPDDVNMGLTNNTEMTSKDTSNANSGDLAASLQKLGQFYIDNVGTYSQESDYVQIDFIGGSFRKDCTGFAIAYMSYVAGKILPDSYTLEIIDPDGSWAKTAGEAGWKVYTSDEIGSLENLQTGDVLIADNRYGYSTKGQHAEIYIDPNHSFGWGATKYTYPTDNVFTVSNSGGHVHIMDGGHDYITVYRYMNATSGTVTDLGAKKINHSSFNHGTKSKENQKYIMLHDTEKDDSPENIVNYWANNNGGTTAAHFVVGRDGTIVQAVDLDVIAHHAGFGGPGDFDSKYGVGSNNRQGTGDDLKGQVTSGYEGYTSYGMNSYSIGIEMVHVSGQDYPEAQLNAVDKVIAYIDTYYGKQSTIIDHKDWRPSNSDTDSNFATYLSNYKSTRHH